ncbi:MAG: hypothetical protein NC314_13525 [Roseburia sp.]|nr:hypothetical protein [Roseburia sp.]MCM1243858.1 hypothetical protein [Roseburia sp.]
MERGLSNGKTIIMVVSAIVILVVAQSMALVCAEAAVAAGCPIAAGNLLAGILYPVVTLALVCFCVIK